ncbi:MAG: zinc dependent phospholipase C family protein [Desulfobacteraceae bacterium]|nr:zinc dependent phospholipase C family protein [Desulfobacteraceae bacterium]
MPKEISHWYLADLVKEGLPVDSVFYKPVHTHENLFFFGAVAPDIPFYYLLGPKKTRIQTVAHSFHQTDVRALMPVFAFFDRMPVSNPHAAALSLGAGIICHILSDTAFHPALDLHFQYLAGAETRTSLGRILAGIEISNLRLLDLLGDLFNLPASRDRTCLEYAIRSHAFYQTMFRYSWLYRILHRINRNRHRLPDLALSLIYPVNQGMDLPFFHQTFQYQDPVTGRPCSAGIPDLNRQVKTSALSLLAMVSDRLARQRPTGSLAGHPNLPLVRPGIKSCRFWRRQGDLLTDLYQIPIP